MSVEPRRDSKGLTALVSGLAIHPRVTVILPAATHRLTLAASAAEELGVRRVVVVVGSEERRQEAALAFGKREDASTPGSSVLCVAATPESGAVTTQRPVDPPPVTSDPARIRAFLASDRAATRVIVTAYADLQLLTAAVRGLSFDLGIFDDAELTARGKGDTSSPTSNSHTTILTDEDLRIERRLFLASTLWHSEVEWRGGQVLLRQLFSLREPEVYGPCVYRETIGSGIQGGRLADYRIALAVVTREMIAAELQRCGVSSTGCRRSLTRWVGYRLALAQACDACQPKGVLGVNDSYLRLSWIAGPEGRALTELLSAYRLRLPGGEHLERVAASSGEATERVAHMLSDLTQLEAAPIAPLAVFLMPSFRALDLPRTIHCLLRDPQPAEVRTLVLPLVIEAPLGEDSDLPAALARSSVSTLEQLLQRLREQDDRLDSLLNELSYETSPEAALDLPALRERFQIIGPSRLLAEADLEHSILRLIGNRLRVEWEARFLQLRRFKERFGHCGVPGDKLETMDLAEWIADQRKAHRRSLLSPDQVKRLESINLGWDASAPIRRKAAQRAHELAMRVAAGLDATSQATTHTRSPHYEGLWNAMLDQLKDYRHRFGDCNVPRDWPENRSLGLWVMTQRSLGRRRRLAAARLEELNALGFSWDILSDRWERQFSKLVEYKSQHGHCEMEPNGGPHDELAKWQGTRQGLHPP